MVLGKKHLACVKRDLVEFLTASNDSCNVNRFVGDEIQYDVTSEPVDQLRPKSICIGAIGRHSASRFRELTEQFGGRFDCVEKSQGGVKIVFGNPL
jgi:hypothetical protein